jgi:hypothetical protein
VADCDDETVGSSWPDPVAVAVGVEAPDAAESPPATWVPPTVMARASPVADA